MDLQPQVTSFLQDGRPEMTSGKAAGVEAFCHACMHGCMCVDCVTFFIHRFLPRHGTVLVKFYLPHVSALLFPALKSPFSYTPNRQPIFVPYNPALLASLVQQPFARSSEDDRPCFAPAQELKGKLRKNAKPRQVRFVR